jgi:hypothetical protein
VGTAAGVWPAAGGQQVARPCYLIKGGGTQKAQKKPCWGLSMKSDLRCDCHNWLKGLPNDGDITKQICKIIYEKSHHQHKILRLYR